jgi:hypothetical protein
MLADNRKRAGNRLIRAMKTHTHTHTHKHTHTHTADGRQQTSSGEQQSAGKRHQIADEIITASINTL